MRLRENRLIEIITIALALGLIMLPLSTAQIIPQQELELSESLTMRWYSEVNCTAEGASLFRSTIDFDNDGNVSEAELQQMLMVMQSETEGYWVQIDGINGTITKTNSLDYSGALGNVYTGGDFTYSFDLEISWPEISEPANEYNLRFINPIFVTKTSTDLNIPDNWEISDYDNFKEVNTNNEETDFIGVIEGAGTSGELTLKKQVETKDDSGNDFMLLISYITLIAVVVLVIIILITLNKSNEKI